MRHAALALVLSLCACSGTPFGVAGDDAGGATHASDAAQLVDVVDATPAAKDAPASADAGELLDGAGGDGGPADSAGDAVAPPDAGAPEAFCCTAGSAAPRGCGGWQWACTLDGGAGGGFCSRDGGGPCATAGLACFFEEVDGAQFYGVVTACP